MKSMHVAIIAAFLSFLAIPAFAQQHIRSVAGKIQSLNEPSMNMTNVVKRHPQTREVASTILEVANLPQKYTKEMVKAIEKDEKNALSTDKYISGGFCTRVLKFQSENSSLSIAMTYNIKTNVAVSLVVREDYSMRRQSKNSGVKGNRTRTRIIYPGVRQIIYIESDDAGTGCCLTADASADSPGESVGRIIYY